MLDAAIRRVEGSTGIDLGSRSAAPWLVHPALAGVLPEGLRRGSAVSLSGSVSLLLAVLGGPSSSGAWCALVGLPPVGAEAAVEYGLELSRVPVIAEPGSRWTALVGALLDTVDVVVVRPPARLVPGDVQRLAARARARDAVLVAYFGPGVEGVWPAADLRLGVRDSAWEGLAGGAGRLRGRRLTVTAEGRGRSSRPRSAALWLPAPGGGLNTIAADPVVLPLTRTG